VAQRQSGEGKNRDAGEKIEPMGGGSILKGSGGEGAEGWAPRGGGAGEREGERGAGRGRDSATARRQAAAARPRSARAAALRAR
jgi:hypothetical protein